MARKKKSLVIVESPAKARTINKYLGPDFEVAASKGHIRDLVKSGMGIDIENGWIPKYRPIADRKELIAALQKQAEKCDMVYLAPDPDREGEAIAWHLKEALKLSDEKTLRVTFNEITKSAIQKAFANPTHIDMDRVAAQEARRFLDRVVGFKLSPLLSQRYAEQLSAGRVQSVAVRVIVDREREIENFKTEEYWRIGAILRPSSYKITPLAVEKKAKGTKAASETVAPKGKGKGKSKKAEEETPTPPSPENEKDLVDPEDQEASSSPEKELPEGSFVAEIAEWDSQKFAANSQEKVDEILKDLEGKPWIVSKIEQKDRQDKPPAPFTTSTLQQQASHRLRFAAKRTMGIAQKLYEGVEVGSEGPVALITYMRTDSTRISEDALKSCRDHIKAAFGDAYLPDAPNRYAASADAQGAHEAIRPTDLSYTPERLAAYLPSDQLRLYTLIYQRFVACQMKPALFAVTSVEVQCSKAIFRASGRILKFDGYRRVWGSSGKTEDTLLPAMIEKELLHLLEIKPSQHWTEPPPRFNEASLVKMLEKEGIGRPSTYATIIDKIQERNYVRLDQRRFFATDLGKKINDLLVDHFPKIMDLQFTRQMETELDQIETKVHERNKVLDDFYEPFSQSLKVAETKLMEDAIKCPLCNKPLVERISRFGKFFGCSGHPECKYIKKKGDENGVREAPKETEHKCPECGNMMLERAGPRGPFLGCSKYPECKVTMSFDQQGLPVLTVKKTDHTCEKCGSPMVLREGRRGPFLACSGYPKCKNAKDVDAQGNPMKPIDTGVVCEKCGAPMGVKKGPRGPFLGCTAYPKCRSSKPMSAELKEKLKDVLPPMPAAKPKIEVEIKDICPDCDAPMKLREGRGGTYFLGCSKYPKCKGRRDPSAELLEQVQDAVTKM